MNARRIAIVGDTDEICLRWKPTVSVADSRNASVSSSADGWTFYEMDLRKAIRAATCF